MDILKRLSSESLVQVILSTHSKEIINYVDPSEIIPLTLGDPRPASLDHHSSVVPILQDLGAVDNADLAAIAASKKCLFVEGKTDRRILSRIAAKMGSTVFEGGSQVVVIVSEGVDNPERYVGLDVMEKILGASLHALVVRDRDCLPDELVAEISQFVSERRRPVVILDRTHIENYLLDPRLIFRAISARGCLPSESMPSEDDVRAVVDDTISNLYDETFDRTCKEIQKHSDIYGAKRLDIMTINQMARDFLDRQWASCDGRAQIVVGKLAMKRIRQVCEEKWGVSFSDVALVEQMSVDGLPETLVAIIRQLEKL